MVFRTYTTEYVKQYKEKVYMPTLKMDLSLPASSIHALQEQCRLWEEPSELSVRLERLSEGQLRLKLSSPQLRLEILLHAASNPLSPKVFLPRSEVLYLRGLALSPEVLQDILCHVCYPEEVSLP
jgi:hypothetical protein